MTDFNDRVERLAEIEGKPTPGQFAIDFYNEALPLLREMAQALSEARAENERLREGIGLALGELEAGKPGDAESILEALNDA